MIPLNVVTYGAAVFSCESKWEAALQVLQDMTYKERQLFKPWTVQHHFKSPPKITGRESRKGFVDQQPCA